jgi:hypothetical protein
MAEKGWLSQRLALGHGLPTSHYITATSNEISHRILQSAFYICLNTPFLTRRLSFSVSGLTPNGATFRTQATLFEAALENVGLRGCLNARQATAITLREVIKL